MLKIISKTLFITIAAIILSIFVFIITLIFTILSLLIIILLLPIVSFNVSYKNLKTKLNRYLYNKRKVKWYKKNVIIWKAISNLNSEQYIYEYSQKWSGNCMIHSSRKNMWYKSCKYIEELFNEKISHKRFFKAHRFSVHNKILFYYSTIKRTRGDIK